MTLRYLTAGESHGQALVAILEGLPAGLPLDLLALHTELKRRKLGYGRGARQTIEDDAVEVLSGVRHGYTLGSPISLLIRNRDWPNWQTTMAVASVADPRAGADRTVSVPRPGHADLVGSLKYGHHDMRNVLERSSARETTIRVAIASVARQFLGACGIYVASRVVQVGSVQDATPLDAELASLNARVDSSPLRCLGKPAEQAMIAEVEAAKARGDTLGGVFEVLAFGVPVGLGSYVHWDRRLEAEIGRQFLSLNAIKGVEVGDGFASAGVPGSLAHDELLPAPHGRVAYASNRAGGITGGMSTGQCVVVRAAMKPISTLMQPLHSVKLETGEVAEAHVERSDVCAVPAAAVIGESLLTLTLAQALLHKFGGDSMAELLPRLEAWHAHTDPA